MGDPCAIASSTPFNGGAQASAPGSSSASSRARRTCPSDAEWIELNVEPGNGEGAGEARGETRATPTPSWCRGDRIRTCDPLVPNQVLYQAEPLPEADTPLSRDALRNRWRPRGSTFRGVRADRVRTDPHIRGDPCTSAPNPRDPWR